MATPPENPQQERLIVRITSTQKAAIREQLAPFESVSGFTRSAIARELARRAGHEVPR